MQEIDRHQGSSNIDETQLPSRDRMERMKKGRVKIRPTKVNMQRGEASQEGCNVDRPSSSTRHLDPRSFDEVVTHSLIFTPPPQTKFTMPTEVPHNAHTSLELPSNIEESESSTPLLTHLIMPLPQPLYQGQIRRGRGGGRGREQGRGYRVPCEGPSNILEMQVYDRRP